MDDLPLQDPAFITPAFREPEHRQAGNRKHSRFSIEHAWNILSGQRQAARTSPRQLISFVALSEMRCTRTPTFGSVCYVPPKLQRVLDAFVQHMDSCRRKHESRDRSKHSQSGSPNLEKQAIQDQGLRVDDQRAKGEKEKEKKETRVRVRRCFRRVHASEFDATKCNTRAQQGMKR